MSQDIFFEVIPIELLRPGDILLVKVPHEQFSREQLEEIEEWAEDTFEHTGAKVSIVWDTISFEIISPNKSDA